MREHFEGLARYNAWANHRLYGAVELLPAAEILLDRPAAFFGSILGTLDHILRADRFWLGNIEHRAAADREDRPAESFAALKAARPHARGRLVVESEATATMLSVLENPYRRAWAPQVTDTTAEYVRLLEALVEVTGKRVRFPDRYDEAARRKLAGAW